jgi:lipopolysaccharide/colanic/teichoic acid biosynthesis glycosyltransferase
MYPDARERFPELYSYDYSEEELKSIAFKLKHDPRVPPWARWMRSSSIDELPNFINVLKGDLTLIGPRPDIPEMVQYYTEEQYSTKLSVKPGVTGFAQIYGRGDLSFQETLDYDLDYVRNASFFLDMKILTLTFFKLFKGRNGGAF